MSTRHIVEASRFGVDTAYEVLGGRRLASRHSAMVHLSRTAIRCRDGWWCRRGKVYWGSAEPSRTPRYERQELIASPVSSTASRAWM